MSTKSDRFPNKTIKICLGPIHSRPIVVQYETVALPRKTTRQMLPFSVRMAYQLQHRIYTLHSHNGATIAGLSADETRKSVCLSFTLTDDIQLIEGV